MYISYGLALAFIFVVGAALWALGWRMDKAAIWAAVLFLPFAPLLTFLSRVLWIYLDQEIDPAPLGDALVTRTMNNERRAFLGSPVLLVKHSHSTHNAGSGCERRLQR